MSCRVAPFLTIPPPTPLVRRQDTDPTGSSSSNGGPSSAHTTAGGVDGAWRAARKEVLKDAVQVHLLPLLEAEARRLLKQRAEEGVVRAAAQALQRVVETGKEGG